GHKDAVSGYVLHNFAKADQDWLDDVLRGVSDGAAALADGDPARFMNAVGLRLAPPRISAREKPPADTPATPKPATKTPAEVGPEPTALQKLMNRFR
ncbi:MAG: aminoacyl-tRNA hydrolase, partial [Paracoccaceae bacterium]